MFFVTIGVTVQRNWNRWITRNELSENTCFPSFGSCHITVT